MDSDLVLKISNNCELKTDLYCVCKCMRGTLYASKDTNYIHLDTLASGHSHLLPPPTPT